MFVRGNIPTLRSLHDTDSPSKGQGTGCRKAPALRDSADQIFEPVSWTLTDSDTLRQAGHSLSVTPPCKLDTHCQ